MNVHFLVIARNPEIIEGDEAIYGRKRHQMRLLPLVPRDSRYSPPTLPSPSRGEEKRGGVRLRTKSARNDDIEVIEWTS